MQQFTPLALIATILIFAVLAFMLFAPSGTVVRAMNWIGGGLQWLFAKVKGLFSKS